MITNLKAIDYPKGLEPSTFGSPLPGESIIARMVLEIDWNWQILAVVNFLLSRIPGVDDF